MNTKLAARWVKIHLALSVVLATVAGVDLFCGSGDSLAGKVSGHGNACDSAALYATASFLVLNLPGVPAFFALGHLWIVIDLWSIIGPTPMDAGNPWWFVYGLVPVGLIVSSEACIAGAIIVGSNLRHRLRRRVKRHRAGIT